MRPFFLLLPCLALAQQSSVTYESLNSVLWQQTAVEYRAISLQTYRAAKPQLDRALKDKRWTAALEQTGNFRKLPPAIVLDVDETVLDNSPSAARAILEGDGRYSAKLWREWTGQGAAQALAGAADFLRYAVSKGVAVFYVTNREMGEEEATRRNIVAQGLPLTAVKHFSDALLMNGEQPDWTSDKTTRRKAIAQHYRILLLFGDDFNDFSAGVRSSLAARDEIAAKVQENWGVKWFILPNPQYGTWEAATLDLQRNLTIEQGIERKKAKLRVK